MDKVRKIRVGIIFGGNSREREISFAGGRTIYDNLDKTLFEPIPVFVDSFGNFVKINWEFVYKGSIRDFYPPVSFYPEGLGHFQVYAEALNPSSDSILAMLEKLGTVIPPEKLSTHFDIAFLCLHGSNGEDGKIQGLLSWYGIPYTGSGILPSAIGINKAVQKNLMQHAGFETPAFLALTRADFLNTDAEGLVSRIKDRVGFPCVVKPANQGSSVGVSVVEKPDSGELLEAFRKAFFIRRISGKFWSDLNEAGKENLLRELCDIRDGLGLPLYNREKAMYNPREILSYVESEINKAGFVEFFGSDSETEVLVEGFIQGTEFSCIVLQDPEGKPLALPPTEIRKKASFYDYRSKYLPGLSRKVTPMETGPENLEKIMREAKRLFEFFRFDVYARIDGFLSKEGKVFLNDPNTTSGMMPSSFFFHQAAEIGLHPSQFVSYILYRSLLSRMEEPGDRNSIGNLKTHFDRLLELKSKNESKKIRVGVVFGGYSSERHISVESGRNIFEKLFSSEKYLPVPLFLTGGNESMRFIQIPVKMLLKDNADDIKDGIENYQVHPVVENIISGANPIVSRFGSGNSIEGPREISISEFSHLFDRIFIALHGRPGEDGAIQKILDKIGIPYNGSGVQSSDITINKFATNRILMETGFLVANHTLLKREEVSRREREVFSTLKKDLGLPFIAKPVDDGCSSAVKKIGSVEEWIAFCGLMFRNSEEKDPRHCDTLKIKLNEEFPIKETVLCEELIAPKGAAHFLEITGGMLQTGESGKDRFLIFEASEALAGGGVLSLEEKFLAGEGQNITPARYARDPEACARISEKVKSVLGKVAETLNVEGYCRIDAFVRIFEDEKVEVIIIEVNSLPGMTPATCIFHQTALEKMKPFAFIDRILEAGAKKMQRGLKQI